MWALNMEFVEVVGGCWQDHQLEMLQECTDAAWVVETRNMCQVEGSMDGKNTQTLQKEPEHHGPEDPEVLHVREKHQTPSRNEVAHADVVVEPSHIQRQIC